jgi:transcriptional regulator with XRE-family HTH domain
MENKRLSELLILIGSNVLAIRMSRALSLEDLEKRTDLDLKTLTEIESGTTESTVRDLLMISDALAVALPSLLTKQQAKEPY